MIVRIEGCSTSSFFDNVCGDRFSLKETLIATIKLSGEGVVEHNQGLRID